MALRCWGLLLAALALPGCGLLPNVAHQPTLHNPFPQLAKVAVAPFFNHSLEPTLDGRQVANAYAHELQSVAGFEVVPVSTVEALMQTRRMTLNSAEDARRLAQALQVDAVVTGSVTDFSPYYPPRMTIHVEWYAANPGYHPIPPGYGLPWGAQGEQYIPRSLVFEAEFALAQEQLKTQTPAYQPLPQAALPGGNAPGAEAGADGKPRAVDAGGNLAADALAAWPDPRGFIPPPPSPSPPPCKPSDAPILRHTRTYSGNDADFTTALASYHGFRDDARFDGWQGYLQRSDEFMRFCCRMHIWEMLSARGGAGETRVVWRWPKIR